MARSIRHGGAVPERLLTARTLYAIASMISLMCLFTNRPASAFDFTVTKMADEVGTCEVNDCALREAIIAANALSGEDRIILPAGAYILARGWGGADTAQAGDLDIQEGLIIDGAGAATTIVEGNGLDRVFHVLPGAGLEMSGVTVQGGWKNSAPGAGILVAESDVALDHVVIQGNTISSVAGGGGIAMYSGSLTIEDSVIAGNRVLSSSSDGGGGIIGWGLSQITILRSRIERNHTGGNGGGISVGTRDPDSLVLIDTIVRYNTAAGLGGGIYYDETTGSTVQRSTISDNNSALSGGGVWVDALTSLQVVNSTISHNAAVLFGGGGFVLGEIHLENATISDNTASLHSALTPSAASTFKSTVLAGTCNVGEIGISLRSQHRESRRQLRPQHSVRSEERTSRRSRSERALDERRPDTYPCAVAGERCDRPGHRRGRRLSRAKRGPARRGPAHRRRRRRRCRLRRRLGRGLSGRDRALLCGRFRVRTPPQMEQRHSLIVERGGGLLL